MTSKSEGKIGAKQRDSVAAQPEAARTVQLALPIHSFRTGAQLRWAEPVTEKSALPCASAGSAALRYTAASM